MNTRGLALATALAWTTVGAQGTVRGVVYDSTRSAGLGGAEVFVLGGSLRAETDSAGAFVVHGVPFGRHTILAIHPRLDSLGLDGLEATVALNAAMPATVVALATPSARSLQQLVCGQVPSADEALLTGSAVTLDGRPVEGATVTIQWVEMRIRSGEATRTPHTVTATTDGFGAYHGCGVPRSLEARVDTSGWTTIVHELRLTARHPGQSTGTLTVFPDAEPIQRIDLALGDEDDAVRASVRGRIVTATGEPIERGRVIAMSDSALTADIDADGAFNLDGLRRRTEQLHVRAVGYIPAWIEVVATDSVLDLGDVALSPIPQRLQTMLVTADRLTRERREFDERKKTGLGTFLDDEEVASYPMLTPAILYMRVPRSALVPGRPGEPSMFGLKRITILGSGTCLPRYFVDGYELRGLSSSEMSYMLADAKRVEVYGAAFAPPKYTDFNGCGAVVIWTR